jgi:hypothetical protein
MWTPDHQIKDNLYTIWRGRIHCLGSMPTPGKFGMSFGIWIEESEERDIKFDWDADHANLPSLEFLQKAQQLTTDELKLIMEAFVYYRVAFQERLAALKEKMGITDRPWLDKHLGSCFLFTASEKELNTLSDFAELSWDTPALADLHMFDYSARKYDHYFKEYKIPFTKRIRTEHWTITRPHYRISLQGFSSTSIPRETRADFHFEQRTDDPTMYDIYWHPVKFGALELHEADFDAGIAWSCDKAEKWLRRAIDFVHDSKRAQLALAKDIRHKRRIMIKNFFKELCMSKSEKAYFNRQTF